MSVPFVQFLAVRWYFRLFIWARFLWQVSRIDLNLEPHASGRHGRTAFLALAESPSGRCCAGWRGARRNDRQQDLLHRRKLLDFKVEIIGTVALLTFVVLGPMLVFTPKLDAVRHRGMVDIRRAGATLCARVRPQVDSQQPPGRRAAARQRGHPVAGRSAQRLPGGQGHARPAIQYEERNGAGAGRSLPVAPLLLTMFSVEQILERVLKVLF